MFEIPGAKRVRREDLRDSDSSSESDGEHEAEIRARLEAQIGLSLDLGGCNEAAAASLAPRGSSLRKQQKASCRQSVTSSDAGDDRNGEEVEEEDETGPLEYDFSLFGGTVAAQTKVILEDEDAPQGEGGLVNPRRPLSFYAVTNVPEEQKRQYSFAAVSGEDVVLRSSWRRWALETPWKVTHIPATRKGRSDASEGKKEAEEEEGDVKRRRPGKKRRIALRAKQRSAKDKAEAAAAQKVEKEEHIKDKKKRMNRLKKMRKRAKNREQKQANAQAADEDGEGPSDDDSGSE